MNVFPLALICCPPKRIAHTPDYCREFAAHLKPMKLDSESGRGEPRRKWFSLYLFAELRREPVIADGGGGGSSVEAERIVRRKNRKFSQIIQTHDLKGIEDIYTEDTVLMPPNDDMVRGRRGTIEFWSASLKMGLRTASLSTLEALRSGDEIRETGTYKLRVVPEHKKGYDEVGKYLMLWKQQSDGTWKLQKGIWNSDLPRKNKK